MLNPCRNNVCTHVCCRSVTSPLRTARGAFFVLTNLPGLSLDHPHESFGAFRFPVIYTRAPADVDVHSRQNLYTSEAEKNTLVNCSM